MSTLMDQEYHDRREAQERAQAKLARDRAAQKIHNEMADRHATEKERKTSQGLFRD